MSYIVELLTAVLCLVLLIASLLLQRYKEKLSLFTGICLFIILIVSLFSGALLNGSQSQSLFGGAYINDPFSTFFKQLFLIAAVLTVLISRDHLVSKQGEFYALIVSALLGMMIMVSSGELIAIYIGLELMTISFCVLIAYKGDDKSKEASLKYLILSAMSSAIFLYGLSLIYGITQTTAIKEIAEALVTGQIAPLEILGMIFLIAGFAFKIAIVPFHMWAPDIYEGALTSITVFLAVASKTAGLAVLLRLFMTGMPSVSSYWIELIVVLAVITLVLGNLVAIPQTNIKRLLAYSSISQAGYFLLGIIANSNLGVASILLYSLFYLFANMGAFGVVIAVSKATGSDEIKDYAYLAKRSPFLAAVMLISLLSLAGIPPLAGFIGKFYLFLSIIEKGQIWLAFLSIGMSVISVYYYLKVVKVMYFGESPTKLESIPVSISTKLALTISMTVLVILGIYPSQVANVVLSVSKAFLS
ncbi:MULTISPECIES: NADH-quinone oxidoreductase subunit N [Clostridium]|uniref:NADH-quinone oxidoreductase subunit N n=1 Tax=Clostridium TaxID=1485 RepID=UPI0003F4F500|nr:MULTISPECIES: NADH-quinone oxidoreductase subunit N [Clostridium]MBN7575127.1 NADH-quinone oxidoreductase subunit N [Clostridium beijerinckii]MBN7580405.1 NADH-quinone oxidoreductase subunit N [Clostridium beijerinckii]MBN7584891.1 NADH-quinone oxidoreductase subunit N [Clostridium beijerinckii]MBO0520614.1 NADH-quinone oxidoreductase subunit N [Clostridium beijerinckii]